MFFLLKINQKSVFKMRPQMVHPCTKLFVHHLLRSDWCSLYFLIVLWDSCFLELVDGCGTALWISVWLIKSYCIWKWSHESFSQQSNGRIKRQSKRPDLLVYIVTLIESWNQEGGGCKKYSDCVILKWPLRLIYSNKLSLRHCVFSSV